MNPKSPQSRPGDAQPLPGLDEPDHSMRDEEPLGWDQAPTEGDADTHRHPRPDGLGGTTEGPERGLVESQDDAGGGNPDPDEAPINPTPSPDERQRQGQ